MELARILSSPREAPARLPRLRPLAAPVVGRRRSAAFPRGSLGRRRPHGPATSLPAARAPSGCLCLQAVARETTSEIALSRVIISVDIARKSDLLELRRQLALHRHYLRELAITNVPLFGAVGDGLWGAAFSLAPNIQSFSMESCREHVPSRISEIVRPLGKLCPDVTTLVLPSTPISLSPSRPQLKEYAYALVGALDQWKRSGASHGIHKFCVGLHHLMTGVPESVNWVDTLIQVCPNAERFNGHSRTRSAIEQWTTDEYWFLDLPTWTRFCSTMNNLTEADWTPWPFATVFFEIFGQYPKPRLKELDICTPMNWNWEKYLSVDSPTKEALLNKGYGGSTTHVHAALRACPNLEEINLHWYNPAIETLTGEPQPSPSGFRYPSTKMMDPSVFGDELCEAIACYQFDDPPMMILCSTSSSAAVSASSLFWLTSVNPKRASAPFIDILLVRGESNWIR